MNKGLIREIDTKKIIVKYDVTHWWTLKCIRFQTETKNKIFFEQTAKSS